MTGIKEWPSTSIGQITTWVMLVTFFGCSIWWIARDTNINEFVFATLAAFVFGDKVTSVWQYIGKRKTEWAPPGIVAPGSTVETQTKVTT